MINLKEVIEKYPECLDNKIKLKAILTDLYPTEKARIRVLVDSFECGIYEKLKSAKEVDNLLINNLSVTLQNDFGYTKELVEWCLGEWKKVFITNDSKLSKDVNAEDNVESLELFDSKQTITNPSLNDFIIQNGVLVKYIGKDQDVVIPDFVKSIGDEAFNNRSKLTSIAIPDSVTSIGRFSFYSCSSLTSVEISNSVTSIGDYAFYGCDKLVEVINLSKLNITKGSTDNGYVGYYALNIKTSGSSAIVNKDGYLFYTYKNPSLNDFIIQNGVLVKYIGKDQDVVIPDFVKSIGDEAFNNRSKLTSIVIPNSVTSIGYRAFYGCSKITSVVIPNSVTSIGNKAFSCCSSLTSVVIGNSVQSIGKYAFYKCSSLTSVEISNSVTSIGDYAFYGCDKLVEVINLSKLNITKGSTDNGYVGYYALNIKTSRSSAIVNKDGYLFYTYKNPSLNDFIIQNGVLVKYIGKDQDVVIPDFVKSIGDRSFYKCSNLLSVKIPNSVTSINNNAFFSCTALTGVIIPNSVEKIGRGAFSYCRSLKSIKFMDSSSWYKKDNHCVSLIDVSNSYINAVVFKSYGFPDLYKGDNK